ncbi:MAG: TIGR04013 family B12-binding domain/radical SAM domain-containing protein [Candidatus Rifleibacteriota bacterium]
MNKPNLIFRIQNYNRVSMGALIGATPDEIMQKFNIIFWESTEPFPEEKIGGRTLYLHSFMLMHLPQINEEISFLRRKSPEIEYLAGGSQATASPDRALEIGFDYVFCGEGEIDFPELLNSWHDNKLQKGIHRQTDRDVELDRFPGFSKLIDYIPPIEITRGCIFGCMYCSVPRLCKGKIKHRSIDSILSVLDQYYRIKKRRKRIKFLTPNAFGYGSEGRTPNLEALNNLLQAIKEFGVPEIQFGSFPGEVRPDFVTREVMEIVSKYAVNRTIVMGVQAGSDRMLKKMNREHSLSQAVNAIKLIREFGYTPHVDFIIGNPGETLRDQVELLDFMEEMIKRYHIKIHMHSFMPIPGAPWQNLDQSYISPEIHKRIKNLEKAGKLDGWWENQIGLGRMEKELRRNQTK